MTRTGKSRALLEADPVSLWTPLVVLIVASILVCALVWPALDTFVASDDDVWLAWCSQPIVDVIKPGAPYETTRPAFAMLMAIESRLFGDYYAGYRLVGFAVHVLAIFMVFLLARPLLGSLRATLAALLFLVAPVHHETLFWISGRPDLLSGTLVLVSLLFFQGARRQERPTTRWTLAVVVALAAVTAALFKETGLIAVPLLLGFALLLPGTRGWKSDLRLAAAVAAPVLAVLPFYLLWSEETGRLSNALLHFPSRALWLVPGLADLVWPIPLDEVRTQIHWSLGSSFKLWVLALSVLVSIGLAVWVRQRLSRPEVRMGLLLLGIGMLPFLMLNSQRLLYLAVAGLAILIVGASRRSLAIPLALALIVAQLAMLRHHADLWSEATEIGRSAGLFLKRVPEDRILLVDYPVMIGEVMGTGAGLNRLRHEKTIEYLAPLRLPHATGWQSSAIVREGEDLVVRRPVLWGDHLNYPCDVSRMSQSVAAIWMDECRGDAAPSVRVRAGELDEVGVYRYSPDGSFGRVELQGTTVDDSR